MWERERESNGMLKKFGGEEEQSIHPTKCWTGIKI